MAVHVDPDVLLVDEVLAVGDEAFQRKCMDKIHEFQQAGKTILFVSHSLGQVEELCTRAIVLNNGMVVDDADPASAIDTLRRIWAPTRSPTGRAGAGHRLQLRRHLRVDHAGRPAGVRPGTPSSVTCSAELTVNDHWARRIDEIHMVAMGGQDYPLFRMVGTADDSLAAPVPGRSGSPSMTCRPSSLGSASACKSWTSTGSHWPTPGRRAVMHSTTSGGLHCSR